MPPPPASRQLQSTLLQCVQLPRLKCHVQSTTKIAAMKAKKAAAEQAQAKLKTKKEKAKAAADKATKTVLEQAMPVDAAPTKATKEEAAVHICGPASPSYPL